MINVMCDQVTSFKLIKYSHCFYTKIEVLSP